MRYLLLALSLAGCGSQAADPILHQPKPGDSVAALAAGPPLVTPGEQMLYRVQLQNVELASMTLAVGDLTELGGKKTIVVQGHAKSIGIANFVAKIDDHFTSWIDVTTGRPLRFVVDEYATNSKSDIEHTEADLAGRSGDTLPVTFHLNDQPPTPEPQKLSMPEIWDYNAFLIAMRSWEGPPGSAITVEVLRSRYLWHVDMKIHGKEKVVTALPTGGELPALRFDGHTYKLDRDGKKAKDSDERNFSVWISDDDGRVPLQIVTRTDYGDVRMELVDYQPGSGTRLRQ